MLEIGDDLPSLEGDAERLALIENRDLIAMAQLGKASTPIDLMDFKDSDQQPSVFYLRESGRQSILTVFNWTEKPLATAIHLSDLGLSAGDRYRVTDVLEQKEINPSSGTLSIDRPAHSVRVLKLVDESVPSRAPSLTLECRQSAATGEDVSLSASANDAEPVLLWHWDFGDGTGADGPNLKHAWTESGDYEVRVTATGLDQATSDKRCSVHVEGRFPTVFQPSAKKRNTSD
jgi:hypothetical protein